MAILTLLGCIGLVFLLPADVWTAPKDLWDSLAPIQEEAEAYGVPKALRLVRGMPRQWRAWTMLRQGLPDSSRVERSYTGRSSAAERRAERDLLIVQRGTAVVISYVLRVKSQPADGALQPMRAGTVPAAAYREFLAPLARGWFFASDTAYSPGKPHRGTVRISVTCWKGRHKVSHAVVAGVDRTPERVAEVLAWTDSLERLSLGAPCAEGYFRQKGWRSQDGRRNARMTNIRLSATLERQIENVAGEVEERRRTAGPERASDFAVLDSLIRQVRAGVQELRRSGSYDGKALELKALSALLLESKARLDSIRR